MDGQVVAVVVFLAGTLVLAAAIVMLARRREAERAARLLAEASTRGWEVMRISDGRVSGYRFQGADQGIGWSIESTRSGSPAGSASSGGSPSHSERTRWHSADAALDAGLVLVGPRQGAAMPLPDLGKLGGLAGLLVQKAIKIMLGEDAEHFAGLREVGLDGGGLGDRVMVWANDAKDAQRLIGAGMENAVAAWPARWPLIVKLSPRGLYLDVQGARILDPVTLDQFAALGVRMAAAWRG